MLNLKKNNSQTKKDLIINIIGQINLLPIPHDQITAEPDERLLDVHRGEDYINRWKDFLPKLIQHKTIKQADYLFLAETIQKEKELIDSFPLTISYEDIHSGNIAIEKDKPDRPVLMDPESIKIANQFSMMAHVANREEMAQKLLLDHRDIVQSIDGLEERLSEALDIFMETNIKDRIYQTFISQDSRPKDAEKIYTLMRMDNLLEGLFYSIDKDDPILKIKNFIYSKILRRQINNLKKLMNN